MARKLPLIFALTGLTASSMAYALGLGGVESRSALNQPLDAKISLTSVQPGDLESLVVTLGSAEAFQRAGVDRPFHLARLRFQVVNADGREPYIRVTTTQPIKEPFLDFLVEASWARGRLIREYTLLLDPPVFSATQQRQPALQAPAQAAASLTPVQPVAAETAVSPAAQSGARAVAAPSQGGISEVSGAGGQYTVQSDDTLWKIARDVAPGGTTVNQTMVALLRANPDAFIDRDMNRLKRGAVLRVPERAQIQEIARAEANATVRTHLARWRQDAGDDSAEVAAAPRADDQARLKVVAPTSEGGEQAASSLLDRDLGSSPENVAKLQRELTLAEESKLNLQAENQELKAQVDALKQQLDAAEKLVNLQIQQSAPATEPASEAVAPVAGPVEAVTDAESPAPVAAAAEQPAAESAVVEPAVAEQPVAQPKPVAPAVVPAASEPEDSLVSLLTQPRNLGVLGGGIAALLALIYLLIRRRRGTAEAAAATTVVIHQDEPPAAEQTETGLQALQDEESDDEFVVPDLPASDPIGEAEVYLAYGRYDQAQEVIGKALALEPQSKDLRLKLLEIMALNHDRAGFESEAESLYERVDGSEDPVWQRAVEMGREIAPEHPLFSGDAAAPATKPAAAAFGVPVEEPVDAGLGLEFDLPADDVESPDMASERDAAPADSGVDSLDFDLDAAAGSPDLAFDPDLNLPSDEASEDGAPALKNEVESALADLEFDLGMFGKSGEAGAAAAADADEPSFEMDSADFDLSDAGSAFDDTVALGEVGDEVSTKLDLARAYLDMGDADGARSLLAEVVDEGNGAQKAEAEKLLQQIA